MYIARAILYTGTNSFKNKKNKEIRDKKIVLEAWFWGELAGGYSNKYKLQTKNRILASESNLRLGSILLVKI